jgi:serine/threonine protein kinase/predicted ATPase
MTAERPDPAAPERKPLPDDVATVFQRTTELTPEQMAGLRAIPVPAADAPTPPTTLGRYRLRSSLGSGGFGTVYLAHDTELDRPVAIKVRRDGPGGRTADIERFLQEARNLARLRHAGVVAVHDVGVFDGGVYIVSDYLEGPDLGRWLTENRPGWPEAARIVAAVADALAHAHARSIVHRDVKPANIILTADGAPVLVDFGLALDEARAGGGERGTVSGTLWYMSPEQSAGTAHRIDGRTDVYSLGVVLYELLTGRLPFRATNALELLRQVRDDEPQPPRQLVRDIPPELERACLKALAKRQQDRYTTATDFADDLRRILQGNSDLSLSRHMPVDTVFRRPPETTVGTHRRDTIVPTSSRTRAREAERRQVSALLCCCDLFESNAYAELDADDQAQMLRAFHQLGEAAVSGFDGTVVQCNERGLLVCFGYPVAREDAARCAATAGLDLLRDMKDFADRLRRQHGLEMTVRVVIHTGQAVVDTKDGAVTMVGEARSAAVHLGETAAPAQVTCTEATRRLFHGQFQCTDMGSQRIKGLPHPIQLFRVEHLRAGGKPIENSAPAELSPLTGRDTELGLLRDRWERACEGMGQVVLLVGEPGLGKSRLVHTLKEHVLGQAVEDEVDAPVIEWRCATHFQNTALYPAIDFYERALAFECEEAPAARFNRLLERLHSYNLASPEAVSLWASLLSLPIPDRYPTLSLTPARQREETFRLMLDWLRLRAERRPILFVAEDLHWADASTIEFLGQFLAEGLHDRILTVLTFRPEFKAPWPAAAHQTTLALARLTRRQVGELMRKKAGDTLPEAVVEQVYERAGGVPLFVEEFTKVVQESGVLDPAKRSDEPGRALLGHDIPSTLQDLVAARLDRMVGSRELARLAAVLGREIGYEVLSAVAGLDEPSLQAELAELVRAEILYSRGRPPRCNYLFKHALLEDALYNSLVKHKRQALHRGVAETLEARFPQTAETQPELLAHHFTEAGLSDKATGFWLKAALRSRERSAEVEAIGHLTRGLSLLSAQDETPERDARELQLLSPLGTAYIASRGYAAPEVGPVFHRARELCSRVGQPEQLFALMLGIWEWHTVRGDLRLCGELAAEGMAFAGARHDPGIVMEALFMSGETKLYRGDFDGARESFATAVAEYDNRERTRYWAAHTSHDAGVTHRSNLAVALWHLGFPDRALEINRDMRRLAREIDHPFSVAYALHHTGWLCQLSRIGAEVRTAAEEEIAIATEQGFALWRATGTFFKGAGLLLQGDSAAALPLLLKGLDAFRATGAALTLPFQLCVLGKAYLQAGQFDDARRALEEGLALAEKNDERCQQAELYRVQGELLLAEAPHRFDAAVDCFRRAIETAQRQQSRAWELRATMSLARLWQQVGRRQEARGVLSAVYSAFTEGFATPDLVDAAALLKTLD